MLAVLCFGLHSICDSDIKWHLSRVVLFLKGFWGFVFTVLFLLFHTYSIPQPILPFVLTPTLAQWDRWILKWKFPEPLPRLSAKPPSSLPRPHPHSVHGVQYCLAFEEGFSQVLIPDLPLVSCKKFLSYIYFVGFFFFF